jgi:peptidyl-dipeptidase Dcp
MKSSIAALALLALAGCASTGTSTNPLFTPSHLQYEAPPFDQIRDEHYRPAIEEGMKRQLAEVEAIATNAEAATFANTIEALERSGALLSRATKVFFSLNQSNTNETMQKTAQELAPRLAAHNDAIVLDSRLFARIKALHDNRERSGLDAEAKYLVERYYLNFGRAGALLSEEDKTKLRALNQELSKLAFEYNDKLLADSAQSAVIVDDVAELKGLSEGDIAAAAQAAKDRNLAGKWVFQLQNTTQQPALLSLANRALRERIYKASIARGRRGNENDTRVNLLRQAALRADRAKLLGHPNWASFVLADTMAGTPEKAFDLMTRLAKPAASAARNEAARIQKLIDAQGGGFRLEPWDWDFYAEQVRKAEYDLDEAEVRPYFELERVIRDGMFHSATLLYGLTFKERRDLPVYHPDVKVWEVFDADGSSLALYYGDFYLRPNKGGGAWMGTFVDQNRLLGKRPVVFNVMNFTKPAPGQPSLLSFDDVTTLFHEFGHALHGLMSDVRYPTFTGTSVANDFGEVPSQIHEHWALHPPVLTHYARHYQTGQPMPQALVEKIKRSSTFNQGYATTEYVASALLDMAWHSLAPGTIPSDVDRFEKETLARFGVDVPQVPPRYHTPYFSHIWYSSYAAGYYSYLWSDVIDEDAWAWFNENGGLTRANGQRFRDLILARGGSMDSAAMYRAFRGRDAAIEPLLESKGMSGPR